MSRSYKKTPKQGHTSAVSEEEDKRAAHQALRARFRAGLAAAPLGADLLFNESNIAHSEVFSHAKDGKQWTPVTRKTVQRGCRTRRAPVDGVDAPKARQLLAK